LKRARVAFLRLPVARPPERFMTAERSPSASDTLALPGGARIARVGTDASPAAIGRLLGSSRAPAAPPRIRAFLEHAREQRVPLTDFFALYRDHIPEAAVLLVPGAGRTAMLFASEPPERTAPGSGDRLQEAAAMIRHAYERCAEPGTLVQALPEPGRGNIEALLAAAGFQFLADISYLERPLAPKRLPAAATWPSGIDVRPWNGTDRRLITDLLQETYIDTLDCPKLHGLRAVDDILDGHLQTGRCDPALWTILHCDGSPCGLMLINPSGSGDTAELVYVGLVPKARGHGLGRQLLRHGLHLATGATLRTMTLAVDDANEPATELYRSEGFRRIARRRAWIHLRRHRDTPRPNGAHTEPSNRT